MPGDLLDDYSIAFTSDEARMIRRPHDDALVITLAIANCEVKRILVDNGSSTNVLFFSALMMMEVDKSQIERMHVILMGFNGESTQAAGMIRLPVYTAGENRMTNFLVMDCPSAYNVILGRPWIQDIRAVPSTYHQIIRFPTRRGIREI